MPITVAMIEEKEFKTKVRGYDPVEVDEFLDDICDEMIVLQEEISNLQARLAQASRTQMYAQPAPQPQRDANAEASDSAQRLLARAQKMYDDTIAEAKREADSILANANTQAQNGQSAALTAECDALRRQVEALRASARSYRDKLLQLLQQQRELLDQNSELF